MDFSEPEKLKLLRHLARDFVEKEVVPLEPTFLNEGWSAVASAARGRAPPRARHGPLRGAPARGVGRRAASPSSSSPT